MNPKQSLSASQTAGAVFMGANTYIGNAPNFMVKSISESSGIEMPSFFGYLPNLRQSLKPVFVDFFAVLSRKALPRCKIRNQKLKLRV